MKTGISLCEKLDVLFEVVVKPNGKPYTNKEVAKATQVTEGHLSFIRTKPHSNPSFSILQELARFFGVPIGYFECETVEECRVFLARVKNGLIERYPEEFADPTVISITMSAMKLSPYGRQELLRLVALVETADQVFQERQLAASAS